ncbi:MAG: addiction module protein [Desulfuromonas sp.]|nr:addiction module protein [Desulfuromonas sp.]
MNPDQIKAAALSMSSADRAQMAQALWESLEGDVSAAHLSHADVINLARSRDEEMENRDVTPISHVELMSRLKP